MATFVYVGDPNDNFSGPDVVQVGGYTFEKGKKVDVPDKTPEDKAALSDMRIVGNSHFVDLSDKETADDIAARKKALDKLEADKAKAEAEQAKRDEADQKERERNLARAEPSRVTAATAPRPPGTVTRDPVPDPFQGRTVEERTQAEDHTKAGKTKS